MERVYYTSAPKYTRSGSVAATAAYTPTSAAATLDHRVPRFPRNTDKSRGLRHFSNRVCEKVKEKGQTNYNEVRRALLALGLTMRARRRLQVADELVAEYFDSLSYPPQSQEKQQYDSKNIRRRVYDALNVLMAMNIIEKEKKEIRWVGLPTSSVAERRRLEEERTQRQERIRQKSDQLREYIIQVGGRLQVHTARVLVLVLASPTRDARCSSSRTSRSCTAIARRSAAPAARPSSPSSTCPSSSSTRSARRTSTVRSHTTSKRAAPPRAFVSPFLAEPSTR